MGEAGKLIAGLVGVVAGLAMGFGALAIVMQRTGGQLFSTPALGLLLALVLVGGGAMLMGYLALWAAGTIERRRKKSKRTTDKRYGKKK